MLRQHMRDIEMIKGMNCSLPTKIIPSQPRLRGGEGEGEGVRRLALRVSLQN